MTREQNSRSAVGGLERLAGLFIPVASEAAPSLEGGTTRARALLTNQVALVLLGWTIVGAGAIACLGAGPMSAAFAPVCVVGYGTALAWNRRGNAAAAGSAVVLSSVLGLSWLTIAHGGVSSSAALCFALVPVIASLTTRGRSVFAWTLLSSLAIFIVYGIEIAGVLTPPEGASGSAFGAGVAVLMTMATLSLVAPLTRLIERRQDAFVGDVVAREGAEDRLQRALDTAVEATRTKNRFLANISHELRSPLNVVIGFSELLAADAADRRDTSRRADLLSIRDAGKALLSRIDDILDFANIEAGRLTLTPQLFELEDLVRGVCDAMQARFDGNGTRLELRSEGELGPMRGDPSRVRQIILQVLDNAAKYTSGGVVKVKVACFVDEGEEMFQIAVHDTGMGMTEEQIALAFEPFTRGDDSSTTRVGGTGMGLALVKRLCLMMGGEVQITSALGAGTRVVIELPTNAYPEGEGRDDEVPRPTESDRYAYDPGRTVLVIDDDRLTRMLMTRTLRSAGYGVATAQNGEQGLRLARMIAPAVITLDVMMPGMDGWEVLSRIKNDPELGSIPVIIMSTLEDTHTGITLGAEHCIPKPADPRVLIQVLERYTTHSTRVA